MLAFDIGCTAMQETVNCPDSESESDSDSESDSSEDVSLSGPQSVLAMGSSGDLDVSDILSMRHLASQGTPCVPPAQAATAAAARELVALINLAADFIEPCIVQFLLKGLYSLWSRSSAARQAVLSTVLSAVLVTSTVIEAFTDKELVHLQIQAPSPQSDRTMLPLQPHALSIDGKEGSSDSWPSEGGPAEAGSEGCRAAHMAPSSGYQLCWEACQPQHSHQLERCTAAAYLKAAYLEFEVISLAKCCMVFLCWLSVQVAPPDHTSRAHAVHSNT